MATVLASASNAKLQSHAQNPFQTTDDADSTDNTDDQLPPWLIRDIRGIRAIRGCPFGFDFR
jgi:hypothetical protein